MYVQVHNMQLTDLDIYIYISNIYRRDKSDTNPIIIRSTIILERCAKIYIFPGV